MKYIILILAVGLGACSSTPAVKPVPIDVTATCSAFALPPVEPVPDPSLSPWKWDFPRNKEGAIIESNIFIGLSHANYTVMLKDWEEVKSTIETYKARLEQINETRKKLNALNQEGTAK